MKSRSFYSDRPLQESTRGRVKDTGSRHCFREGRIVILGDGFAEGFGDLLFIPGPQVGLARALSRNLRAVRQDPMYV